MPDWRTIVISNFIPGVKPVTAVSDPDQILREPILLKLVEERGFAVVFFDDPIAFRLDYEECFRSQWDEGKRAEVVVAFQPGEHDFETLPVDVLEKARQVSLHLKDIFPRLSYDVLRNLETIHFDALFTAHQTYATQPLGEAMTKDFILRYLFEVDGNLIASDSSLLCFLCRLHYRRSMLPEMLASHLENILVKRFEDWPLSLLLRNRAAFFAFLQERWPIFLAASDGGRTTVREKQDLLTYKGPRLLPFAHDDVRVFIDNFFEDGILTPVEWDWKHAAEKTWIRVGLVGMGDQNTDLRLKELIGNIQREIPDSISQPAAWLNFALRWGQTRMLWQEASSHLRNEEGNAYRALASSIAGKFRGWLGDTYPHIYNYPPSTPVMVHHTPAYLARLLDKKEAERVAFILVDGLAIDQWLALKGTIKPRIGRVLMEESALFAWVPSITPVSRQAAFSGKIPVYFSESISETSKDELRWKQFWSNRGLHQSEIAFVATRGEDGDARTVEDWLSADTKALGITLYKVDEIMHGMQLGAAGMLNQVRMWGEGDALVSIIQFLLSRNFTVVIAADHGNVEAIGIGVPQQGVLCDTRGERCRVFNEATFAEDCVLAVEGSCLWRHPGLPLNYIPVLAPEGAAFIQQGIKSVCHGGGSLEELAVPFVTIRPGVVT